MKPIKNRIQTILILFAAGTLIFHSQCQIQAMQWKLIGPGTRGTMHAPAFHPTNPEIFCVGIDMGLHFITRDGGETWEILGKHVTSKYKYAGYPGYRGAHETVFDPRNPEIIWAGGTHGIYKSMDGGETWDFLLGGKSEYFIGNIALDPTDPNIAYAGSGEPGAGYFQGWINGNVIYKTVDGGKSWDTINPLHEKQKRDKAWACILIDPTSSFIEGKGHKRIYALRHSKSDSPGLIISQDYGSTWTKEHTLVNGDTNFPGFNYLTMVIDQKKTILFATVIPIRIGDRFYGGVYRSDDLGTTWVERNSGLETAIGMSRKKRYIKIASSPANPDILFCVVDNKVFKSIDQALTWQQVLFPIGRWQNDIPDFDGRYAEYLLPNKEGNWSQSRRGILGGFHSIAMSSSNADYVIVTGKFGGAITTDGGKTWFDIGFNYGEKSSVYDLAIKKFGPIKYPSIYTHQRKAAKNFQVIVPNDMAVDPFNNNIAIAYGDEGLQISRDGGSWWEWSYWGILFREAVDARAVIYDPDIKNRLYLGTMGKVDLQNLEGKKIWKLYQSDDGGSSFKNIGPDLMNSHRLIGDHLKKFDGKRENMITLGVKDILIDPTTSPDNRTMYIAYSTGVYKTIDGARTWEKILNFNPDNISDYGNDKYYLKFEMNPNNNLEIYLASYEGLYKTFDGGKVWKKVSPVILGTIKSLSIARSDPDVIYVVATKGEGQVGHWLDSFLWRSIDAGKTWEKLDEQQTQFVTVHPADKNIVYRALYARDVRYEDTGLFCSKDAGMTWNKINPNLPMSFKGGFKHNVRIVFDPKNFGHFFVVTWCGVYEGWDKDII